MGGHISGVLIRGSLFSIIEALLMRKHILSLNSFIEIALSCTCMHDCIIIAMNFDCMLIVFQSRIKDRFLMLGVASLVAVDLLILITYTLVEGIRGNLQAKKVTSSEMPITTEGVRNNHTSWNPLI